MIEIQIGCDFNSGISKIMFSYKNEPPIRCVLDKSSTISEVATKDLMNMCMKAMRDAKDSKAEKIKEDSKRIKFIGVDYD